MANQQITPLTFMQDNRHVQEYAPDYTAYNSAYESKTLHSFNRHADYR